MVNMNLQCGDCLELLKKIPDNTIDLVITDPPYEIVPGGAGGAFGSKNRNYHEQYSVLDNEKNRKNGIRCTGFDIAILDEICRCMKKINIYIWCSKLQIRKLLDYFEDRDCVIDILTWHKTNPTPTCNNTYLSDTEYLLMFKEKGCKIYCTYETKSKHFISSINKDDKEQFLHPTIKPLNFVKSYILNSTQPNDILLDCFCGSGTTCLACKATGRRYIGMEIEPKYYRIAVNRLNGITANGQTSIFTDFSKL
jgi:DNA modification methylase